MKRTKLSSTRFGAAKGKGRTASIQNETMEIFKCKRENNSLSLSSKNLEEYFTMEGTLVACKDVDGLCKTLNMSHCSDEWRLFIHSSKVSIKGVLLHKRKVLPSISLTHAFGIKERDESMKQLLQYIKYDTYKWNIVHRGVQEVLGKRQICCSYQNRTPEHSAHRINNVLQSIITFITDFKLIGLDLEILNSNDESYTIYEAK